MNIPIILNIVLWSYVIKNYLVSRKINLKIENKNNLIIILFMILGIIIFIKKPNTTTILNFISFSIAGFILSNLSNGFSDDGIILYGNLYRFKKIKEIEKINRYDDSIIRFRIKNKDYYLNLYNLDFKSIEKYLQKIGK